jgi:SAM-dependent methyltransferase
VSFVRADILALPFSAASFQFALDRGCLHYLPPGQWADYAAEVRRVLRPGGRLLLRACLTSRGVRNEVSESLISRSFAGWTVEAVTRAELPSHTRMMPALVVRLRRD